MKGLFPQRALAITEALLCDRIGPEAVPMADSVSAFVVAQHSRMPDYLRLPLIVLTLVCDWWPIVFGFGRSLHSLPLEQRRRSAFGLEGISHRRSSQPDQVLREPGGFRLGRAGARNIPMTSVLSDPPETLSAEILVLGSGPGGTTTALPPRRGGPRRSSHRGRSARSPRCRRAVLAPRDGAEIPQWRSDGGIWRDPGAICRGAVRRRRQRGE